MATRIQIRRDTASNWATANTILAQGELAMETDNGKIKIGDGTTAFSALIRYQSFLISFFFINGVM